MLTFSIVVPVYNRPDEVDELLGSLTEQTDKGFEVVIVEDGSTNRCEEVCRQYSSILDIKYFYKDNSGPGQSRNYGAAHSNGNYLIILDSDVIVPSHYIATVRGELTDNYCDAYGGADAADESFSDMQKAVNYAMTSFITTGGIRGGRRQMERFHPRSFNLGISKDAFDAIGGFSDMRYGEDIDLSIRIYKANYSVRLFDRAYVYHKRRTDLEKFFAQVRHSGNARIILWKKHSDYSGALKAVHFLPAAFTVFASVFAFLGLFNFSFLIPLVVFAMIVFVDSSLKNRSAKIGLLSVVTAFVQLYGYGVGFIEEFLRTKSAK